MIKKLLLKFSSLLYRVHLYINQICSEKASSISNFVPYTLNYQPSQSSIKIIHFNGNFIIGGTSQLIVDIIERTSDKYTHKIVVPEYPIPLPYQPVNINMFSLYEMAKLFEYLKQENPTLVHIHYWVRHIHRHEYFAYWYEAVFKICEELNIKVIQNINVPTRPFVSKTIAHNVFVSKYVQENFDNHLSISSVIYPGSNFQHFQNNDIHALPNNAIGMVYRLDQDKLNANAIEVFITAVKKDPKIICYIIGGGYFLEYYKERVAAEQLEKSFTFTGVVSYSLLPEYYKRFSVFVAPVHDESFGQVTPFAMSMGLSVVGYNTGALSEILGYNDTLVDYGNIEGLADVIINLVKDPEERIKLGQINQERAHQNFSVESMINGYRDLYDSYTT